MSSIQRISVLVGALLASLMLFIVVQGATQEAQTQDRITGQPPGEEPSFRVSDDGDFVEGEIIVKLEEDATQSDLAALNRRNDSRTEENLPLDKASVVDLPRDLPVRAAVEIYENSPDVDYAEPDYLLEPTRSPNDTYYDRYMYGPNNTGQTGGAPDADIDAPEAWENTTGDPNTVVAVIDTG
jgi:thermitase